MPTRVVVAAAVLSTATFVASAAIDTSPANAAANGLAGWVEVDATSAPLIGLTADDQATGQFVAYGPADWCSATNPTAVWDGATWTHATNGAVGVRSGAVLVYDGKTQQLLLFGGWHVPCGSVDGEYLNDTWTWNGFRWTQLHPATSPPPQAGGCAAYDPETGQVVLAGGGNHDGDDHDTWSWDGATWTPVVGVTPLSLAPVSSGCSMVFDPASGSVVAAELDADFPAMATWLWTGSNWAPQPHTGPTGNGHSWMAYDPQFGHVVLYDDETCAKPDPLPCATSGPTESQLWELANNTWTLLPASPVPPPRLAGGFGYDAGTGQLLVFGGQNGRTDLADTWVYGARAGSTVTPIRLAGADRDATAVAVSHATYPAAQSAGAVVLARDDGFADALVGGPLAAAQRAPLLLTPSDALATATSVELQRVLSPGGTVYLMGGPTALTPRLENEVNALGYRTIRIAGPDRFATAVAVANLLGSPSTVLEASGLNYPDALSSVSAAASVDGVILLTNGSKQATETATYLADHPGNRYAVGGAAAGADPSAIAIVGTDRYATNAAVARAFFPTTTSATVATGIGFADALAGGVLCAATGAPMLLVPPTSLPEPVKAYVATHGATLASVDVIGGTTVISEAVVAAITATVSNS